MKEGREYSEKFILGIEPNFWILVEQFESVLEQICKKALQRRQKTKEIPKGVTQETSSELRSEACRERKALTKEWRGSWRTLVARFPNTEIKGILFDGIWMLEDKHEPLQILRENCVRLLTAYQANLPTKCKVKIHPFPTWKNTDLCIPHNVF